MSLRAKRSKLRLLRDFVPRNDSRRLRVDSAISMERQYYIYIMSNKNKTVLYTGVTNDLRRRVYEHKEKLIEGFTKKYNINKLVYYESFRDVESAILREKQIKGGSRAKKIGLINSTNLDWKDLYDNL